MNTYHLKITLAYLISIGITSLLLFSTKFPERKQVKVHTFSEESKKYFQEIAFGSEYGNGWTGYVNGDPIKATNRTSTKFKLESIGSISGVTAADVENNVEVGTLDAVVIEAGKTYSFVNEAGEKGYIYVKAINNSNNNALTAEFEIIVQNKD